MSPLVRSLLVWLLLLVACLAAFITLAWWARPGASWLEVQGAVLGGAVMMWVGVQFGRAALKRLRERVAVGGPDATGRPEDGAFVVLAGVLQTMTPLRTPFTGVEAVAYGYKAWRRERWGRSEKNTREVAYWWGEGSAPCTLLTPAGSFAVRSRLELDLWSAMVENTVAAQDHFAAFMRDATPEVGPVAIARPGFDWDTPLDGLVRRDKQRQVDSPSFGALKLHEWVVTPGEPVVLMGRYSAVRGGLVHDDRAGRPLRVLKGDVAAVRSQLQSGATSYGVLSLVALGIAAMLAGSLLGWHDLGF
jgi:hypothetical protein